MLQKNKREVQYLFLYNFIIDVYIKETKKITKFKFRGPRFLYTFKTNDKNKAAKIL